MKAIMEYNHNWPRVPYTQIPPEEYLIPHMGQRKLLVAEAAFMAHYSTLSRKVVYAGAAPGVHIKRLAELFPTNKFYLFDPRDFDPELKKLPNVRLHQEYFTDQICMRFPGCLFISDIRSAGKDHQSEVEYNLQQQMKWCQILRPIMASLKFRMPHTVKDKIMRYYAGEIMLQAWAGRDSTETRLWTKCTEIRDYSTHDYEQRMFYYNSVLRLGDYNVGQLCCPGMDQCNDCAIEWSTWKMFGDPAKFVEPIDLPPHGLHATTPRAERVKLLAAQGAEFYKKYQFHEAKRKKSHKATKHN